MDKVEAASLPLGMAPDNGIYLKTQAAGMPLPL
jgi:hypothetical protein